MAPSVARCDVPQWHFVEQVAAGGGVDVECAGFVGLRREEEATAEERRVEGERRREVEPRGGCGGGSGKEKQSGKSGW